MLGIIGAMDEEVAQIKEKMTDVTVTSVAGMDFYQGKLGGKDAVVVRSGIGKVNAGMCSQILADRFHISAIVNTGIAGSLRAEINIGDIVVSTDAVQHDMDTSPIGDPVGFVSKIGLVEIPCDNVLREKLVRAAKGVSDLRVHEGVIATGDQFIADGDTRKRIHDRFHAKAVEMEGGAVAHACYMHGVPCGIIRSISDQANGNSTMDYPTFVRLAAVHSAAVVERLLREEMTCGA